MSGRVNVFSHLFSPGISSAINDVCSHFTLFFFSFFSLCVVVTSIPYVCIPLLSVSCLPAILVLHNANYSIICKYNYVIKYFSHNCTHSHLWNIGAHLRSASRLNGSELILQIVIVKSLNFAGLLREFRVDPPSFPFPSFLFTPSPPSLSLSRPPFLYLFSFFFRLSPSPLFVRKAL